MDILRLHIQHWLIDPNIIKAVIPQDKPDSSFYVSNLMTEIKSPVEAVDFTNIKVVTDEESNGGYINSWNFGNNAIHGIIKNLEEAKIDNEPSGSYWL